MECDPKDKLIRAHWDNFSHRAHSIEAHTHAHLVGTKPNQNDENDDRANLQQASPHDRPLAWRERPSAVGERALGQTMQDSDKINHTAPGWGAQRVHVSLQAQTASDIAHESPVEGARDRRER